MDKFELYRKTDKVELFGQEFLLAERSEKDERSLAVAVSGKDVSDSDITLATTYEVLRDGLKINIDKIPKWKVIQRYKLKRLFSNKSFADIPKRLRLQCCLKIMELEGNEIDWEKMGVKKKVPMKEAQ